VVRRNAEQARAAADRAKKNGKGKQNAGGSRWDERSDRDDLSEFDDYYDRD
jgi:hypothetical protein